MKELIEKQAVIDALLAKMDTINDKPDVVLGLAVAAGMIKDMPSALEQEPCDAVSRKAAIDACLKGLNRKEMVSNIKALPSVHPECTEDYCPAAFKPVECKDYISRQAAIDINENHHGQMPNHINHQIWQEIKDLPSVTPAEKVGHWVFVKGYEGILYECTVCRNKNTHTTVRWNYCPHCGVKMQEVEE